ncbi:MAG: radical SAM family heme chaperone HemW [Gemmatimonadetes bacterium]|nr:radical SAM family heme chaperone HemW [Gemmatimonadota bacterium]
MAGPRHLPPCPPHVYVHVPFCARRCAYCDFSIAVRREVPASRFIDAIKAEVVTRAIGPAVSGVGSIYFGGGTPSKLGPEIANLTELISTTAGVSASSIGEITVEANPEDISVGVVASWRDAGVNRVSLGVQTFDPAVLSWMHRTHTVEQVAEAVQILVGSGLDNISLDLIFALPDSLGRDWRRDLDRALELAPKHVSLYGLTVEPHTPLSRWTERGRLSGASEERYEAEFLEADRVLGAAGFLHYEVSNYALSGFEAQHNSAYWAEAEYLGLGPSAHGFDGETRRWNQREYARWLERVEAGQDPMEGEETLWPAERAAERIYLGLRTAKGLRATEEEFARARGWIDQGWARRERDRLVLTPLGWLRLDSLAAGLI